MGSLCLDLPPQFVAFAGIVPPLQDYAASSSLSRTICTLQDRSPKISDICPLLESLSGFTQLAAGKLPCHWDGDTTLTQTLSFVLCDMLTLPRYEIPGDITDPSAAGLILREAIRLASLLFLTGPVICLAGSTEINTNHRGRLPKLLRSQALDLSGLDELELWMLVIGALIEIDGERAWIIRRITRIMQRNGLDWQGVLHVVGQIAWIGGDSSDEVDRMGTDVYQMRSNQPYSMC